VIYFSGYNQKMSLEDISVVGNYWKFRIEEQKQRLHRIRSEVYSYLSPEEIKRRALNPSKGLTNSFDEEPSIVAEADKLEDVISEAVKYLTIEVTCEGKRYLLKDLIYRRQEPSERDYFKSLTNILGQ
jgi:hypothetical protein